MLAITDVSFPHLGIEIENLKNSISVFGFSIAYYGIIIGIGMLCGVLLATFLAKKNGENVDMYYDYAMFTLVAAIIGARIYYVIFAWDEYKDNLWEIFNIRAGGLAIYGGVLASALTLFIFCKVRKVSFFQIGDNAVYGLLLGQAIGRWGNFFNMEAFGGYTDNLFAMRLNRAKVYSSMITAQLNADMEANLPDLAADYIQVHPTFLYESMWNLGVLCLMLFYRKHKKFQGELTWLYFLVYGLGRIWIEGLRTDQLKLWHTSLAVSQWLSLLLIILAVIMIIRGRKKARAASTSLPVGEKTAEDETKN